MLPGFDVCGECGGHGYLGEFEHVDPYTGDHLGNELIPCPTCSGVGSVPDDATVEAVAEAMYVEDTGRNDCWQDEVLKGRTAYRWRELARAGLVAYAQSVKENQR